jgi:hypothetical protein
MVNWQDLPKLSEDELEMCRKAFQLFDKDGGWLHCGLCRTTEVKPAKLFGLQGVVQSM